MIGQAFRYQQTSSLVLLGFASVAAALTLLRERRQPGSVRGLGFVTLGFGLLACASLTLLTTETRSVPGHETMDLRPFRFLATLLSDPAPAQIAEILGNVVMWVPAAVALGCLLGRAWTSIILVGLLGISVEILQLGSRSGRASTIDDVILALIGGLLSSVLLSAATTKQSGRVRG